MKYVIDSLDGVDEALKGHYEQHADGKYRLKLEDTNPDALAKKNAELLAEKKSVAEKLRETETAAETAERERLAKNQEFEALASRHQADAAKWKGDYDALSARVANAARSEQSAKIAGALTRDVKRAEVLAEKAASFVEYTQDGSVRLRHPETGQEMTADAIGKHLAEAYPFLADGVQSSGGGAAGGSSKEATSPGDLGGSKTDRVAAIGKMFPELAKG